MAKRKTDVPKIVAMIILLAPSSVLRVGVAYLRLKRGARRGGARFRAELLKGGVPPEQAKELSYKYESELRLTEVLRKMRPLW